MKIAGLLLAAGASQRLGQAKQLLQIDGETLVHRAARALLDGGCAPVRVVTGAAAESCQSALGDLPVQTTFNERYHQGMGTSVAAGIAALQRQMSLDGVVIAVCDQPFLSAELISGLMQRYYESHASIVACNYGADENGPLGPPALFLSAHFRELEQLTGDQGARHLMLKHAAKTATIPFPQGRIDIDTAADWRALIMKPTT